MFGHTPPSHAPRTQPSTPPPPPFHARVFASPPLPSHARPSRGGDPWLFDTILTSSASLACQSEPEVVSRGSNTLHAPSTSLACQIEPEGDIHGVSVSFTPLACKSKPEVNVHGLSMPFPPSTPPLPARLSQMWAFMAFWRCSRLLHLARKTELEGVSWCVMAWVCQLGHDP